MATEQADGSICYSSSELYQRLTIEMMAFTEWMEGQGFRYCRKVDGAYEYYPLAREDIYDYFGFDPVASRRERRAQLIREDNDGN